MRKSFVATVSTAAVIVLTLAGCSSSDGGSSDASSGSPSPGGSSAAADFSPLRMAAIPGGVDLNTSAFNLGYYDNLPLTRTDVDAGPAALPLISRGDLDGMFEIGSLPLMIAYANDVPVKVVWGTSLFPLDLVVKGGLESPEDIKGKRIAVAGGSVAQYMLAKWLEDNGMTMDDIKMVNLAPTSMASAFASGAIDGAFVHFPPSGALEQAGGVRVGTDEDIAYHILSEDFISSHPDEVQAFVCDSLEAQTDFASDPDPFWKSVDEAAGGDQELVQRNLAQDAAVSGPDLVTEDWFGTPDSESSSRAQSLADVAAWLNDEGMASGDVPTPEDIQANLFDLSFMEAAVNGDACQ